MFYFNELAFFQTFTHPWASGYSSSVKMYAVSTLPIPVMLCSSLHGSNYGFNYIIHSLCLHNKLQEEIGGYLKEYHARVSFYLTPFACWLSARCFGAAASIQGVSDARHYELILAVIVSEVVSACCYFLREQPVKKTDIFSFSLK